MAFFPQQIAHALAGLADLIDAHLRAQLSAQVIANERDYCSCFAVLFRNQCEGLSIPGLTVKVVINSNVMETATGSDLRFVFCLDNNKYKILLAEAKIFRPAKPNSWDRLIKRPVGPNISHFDRQLGKQQAHPQYSFVEMFFVNAALGVPQFGLLTYGTTCFRLDDVIAYRLSSVPAMPWIKQWKGADLGFLSATQPKYSIGQAMYLTAICKWGEPIDYIDEMHHRHSIFINFTIDET